MVWHRESGFLCHAVALLQQAEWPQLKSHNQELGVRAVASPQSRSCWRCTWSMLPPPGQGSGTPGTISCQWTQEGRRKQTQFVERKDMSFCPDGEAGWIRHGWISNKAENPSWAKFFHIASFCWLSQFMVNVGFHCNLEGCAYSCSFFQGIKHLTVEFLMSLANSYT